MSKFCVPPNIALHARVMDRLNECVRIVNQHRPGFAVPELFYFTNKRSAGTAWINGEHRIGINRTLLEENPESMVHETIAHEVAHLTTVHLATKATTPESDSARQISASLQLRLHRMRYKKRQNVHDHGREWQAIMRRWFNVEPSRLHQYDCTSMKIRKQMRWLYTCSNTCTRHEHAITTVRHNRMQIGWTNKNGRFRKLTLVCRRCRNPLVFADQRVS